MPLIVGAIVISCTILIHGLGVMMVVRYVRREKDRGRAGKGFWGDFVIVATAIQIALVAHLLETGLWAVVFEWCGEFHDFAAAYYHSAVNYSTLGYGDVVMSPSWRLMGPLEAADGMLMFGVSTAMVFALIQGLIQARFIDLRDT